MAAGKRTIDASGRRRQHGANIPAPLLWRHSQLWWRHPSDESGVARTTLRRELAALFDPRPGLTGQVAPFWAVPIREGFAGGRGAGVTGAGAGAAGAGAGVLGTGAAGAGAGTFAIGQINLSYRRLRGGSIPRNTLVGGGSVPRNAGPIRDGFGGGSGAGVTGAGVTGAGVTGAGVTGAGGGSARFSGRARWRRKRNWIRCHVQLNLSVM